MKSFEQLSHRVQINKLRKLAQEVAKRYPVEPESISLLQYEDNAVFKLTETGGESYILRISAPDGYSEVEQMSEITWLNALNRETDVIVPQPVATSDGQPLVIVSDSRWGVKPRVCVLFRWIPGSLPNKKLTPTLVEQMGQVTAKLHNHAESFAPAGKFVRPDWGWERLFGADSVFASDKAGRHLTSDETDIFAQAGDRIRDALKNQGKDRSRYGLIHSDLHRGNVLVHEGSVRVIDFDDCGWSYYLLDVATMLSSLYRMLQNDLPKYSTLKEAYLKGYTSVRALPPDWDESLGVFLVMRDMVIVNFILSSENEQVMSWGIDRVKGIIPQVGAFLKHGRYVGHEIYA
ncbi:phosphotransferase enzyme family protein [Cohnella sp. REN36]|uniref:phosphotransferase enzyme family protein n=1 Tax=Cohnella sp. REN36 TaxID=2887347 RepID=UPI001D15A016|nr:phosphotransferase [Cohnella sp. REN36]MCC3372326.1 phosphotransferase [Cohnella sp. REN36]